MQAWKIETIQAAPDKLLDAWRVFEVPFEGANAPWTRHFIGFNRVSGKGRVSTSVIAFDPSRRLGRTQSGRIYHLAGSPGGNSDALYMWGIFKQANHLTDERDVTLEVDAMLCHTAITKPQEGSA